MMGAISLGAVASIRDTIDSYFHAFSVGNVFNVVDHFADDASGTFPSLPGGAPGGTVHGREELINFYTNATTTMRIRHTRATEIVVDGSRAAAALRCSGVLSTGDPYAVDNMNLFDFADDGRVQS